MTISMSISQVLLFSLALLILDGSAFAANAEQTKVNRHYYTSGELAGETFFDRDGRLTGMKQYYENGKLKFESVGGATDFTARGFYDDGTLQAEGEQRNNLFIGTMKEYYRSGALKAEKEHENGRVIHSKTYYENGALESEETDDFLRVYDPHGVKLQDRRYKNQKRDMVDHQYYKSGKLESILETHNGLGEKKRFYENGKVKAEIQLKSGQAVHVKEYDSEGRLVKKWDVADGPYQT